ncbi:MAG: carbohydrate ABC transporter permease [Hyphomicrobiaceae bacterium]|nr:carbohydrate ABC transporter permease [Hyphomicrobiaceae bacterium]
MTRPLERPRMERVENLLITSTLLLMVVITVQPILNLLAISFSDPAQVPGKSGLDIWPSGFSTQIWEILVLHPSVLRGLANSALITIGGTLINVTFTAMMAYAMSRPNLPGRRPLYIFVLITIAFEPGSVSGGRRSNCDALA